MAIIKHGDDQPIEAIYKAGGEEEKCPFCGKKLVVIAMDDQENKLICPDCEEESDQ